MTESEMDIFHPTNACSFAEIDYVAKVNIFYHIGRKISNILTLFSFKAFDNFVLLSSSERLETIDKSLLLEMGSYEWPSKCCIHDCNFRRNGRKSCKKW